MNVRFVDILTLLLSMVVLPVSTMIVSCTSDRQGLDAQLQSIATDIDAELRQARESIEKLRAQAEALYNDADKFRKGLYDDGRYDFYKDTVYYSPENDGHCEIWASGFVAVDDRVRSAVKLVEYLCPDLEAAFKANPLTASLYITTADSIMAGVPYSNANAYLEPGLDITREWVTYRLADEVHNPSKTHVWVPPYLDAMGRGYMTSVITPVYRGPVLKATLGIDITSASIQRTFLRDTGKRLMLITPDLLMVAVNPDCGQLLDIQGPGDHLYLNKAARNAPISQAFNLGVHPSAAARKVADRLQGKSGDSSVQIADQTYRVVSVPIAETGWRLVEIK